MVCDVRILGLLGFTWPWLSTMMRSQLSTVCSLCAMVNVVQSWNELRMVSWIRESVSVSIAAVASSKIKIYTEVEGKNKIKSNHRHVLRSEQSLHSLLFFNAISSVLLGELLAKVQAHGP